MEVPMLGIGFALRVGVPYATGVKRAGAAALGHAKAFAVALSHRRAVKRLCAWDDRMLKDIGLTRSDVVGALSEPLSRDPSAVLAARVGRRPTGVSGGRTRSSPASKEQQGVPSNWNASSRKQTCGSSAC
jgi:uncharacterized protein YjiS (DUF1127 family)